MRFVGTPSGWVLGLAAALASLVPPGIEIAVCKARGMSVTVRTATSAHGECSCCCCRKAPAAPVSTDAGRSCRDCCTSIPLPSGTQAPAPAPRTSSPDDGAPGLLAAPPAASFLPAIPVLPVPWTGPPGDAGPVPAVFPLPLRI